MRRREFITALGGAAAWPIATRGQQGNAPRRVGVLMDGEESDSELKTWLTAFVAGIA
jgi:putative ABC transport system substrate-binding protein